MSQPTRRYICIHAHFYQPPRENPWLEAVELQDSAYPYHDWNERITAECYAPNSVSRILDGQNQIIRLVNNYSKISFNFGPTLLSWLESNSPDVYAAILDADRESQQNFSGHGSALAQVYNHMILPLANARDRRTQILWGIQDFERRFKRVPEGIWLAETAVDTESLEILAEFGIRFTILAPHQARRVRVIGGRVWQDVTGARIDPTQPYEQRLPSGRKIALFFYDGLIARAVAFEGLLSSGEHLASRLIGAFSDEHERSQLVHIATDGESYGHHHRFGDMALAYALNIIESKHLAHLTNYGEFLERHPPTHQVEIIERTSWSCCHGIDRWWRNCGCRSGGDPEWNQEWRTPLRNALDGLRDGLVVPFYERGRQLLKDPWVARNDYLSVAHDRSTASVEQFFARHTVRPLTATEITIVLKLLELQRHAMLMYASCGWFFDELSGIETVQTLHFAGRAVQLAQELFGDSLEWQFMERLAEAKSNLPKYGDGRRIYEQLVRPAMADWEQVGAHYAISSLFENYPEQAKMFCYRTERRNYQTFKAGMATFALGRVKVTSEITWESVVLDFGVIHMGNHHVNGGVQEFYGAETDPILVPDVVESFLRADFAEVIRCLDRSFGESNYSLQSLFRDEQRKVLEQILSTSVLEAESLYRQIYEQRAPMMRFLTHLHIPLPKAFHAAAELILGESLRRALEQENVDPEQINMLLETGKLEGVSLDTATLEFAFRHNLERMAERALTQPTLDSLQQLDRAARLLAALPFVVDIWSIQNRYYRLLNEVYPNVCRQMEGDRAVQEWIDVFESLGKKLAVKVR